jgi:FhaA, N-terminal domain/FHA domain
VGVLQRFERRLEGLVGTAFARLFKGQVEPVEVAKALQREAEARRAIVGSDRVLVPNRYVVELGPSDHERLAPWEAQLTNTLAEMVQEYVDDEGWSTFGDIEVRLQRNDDFRTGMFTVDSSVDPNAGPRRRPYNSLSMPAVPGGYPGDAYRDGYGEPGYAGGVQAGQGYGGQAYGGQGYPEQGYREGYPDQGYGQAYGQPAGSPPATMPPPYQRAQVRHLLTVDGSDQWHELRPGSNVVGRGQDADLRLPDTGVSRRHIDIRFDAGGAVLHDLGSTNGTTVNGHRVQSWQLQHGDVIRLGHTVLVYRQDPA